MRITQDGGQNTLIVDQSEAVGSIVGGRSLILDDDKSAFARQIGAGNSATILDGGNGNRIALEQNSGTSGEGNSATIAVDAAAGTLGRSATPDAGSALASDFAGGNTAFVFQDGRGNSADVSVNGQLSGAGAIQIGNDNQAEVDVEGNQVFGGILQQGNNNAAALSVVGAPGTNVIYNQIGNNLVGAPPSVVSNGATVFITQSTFGQ
ncbi:hypothetical protein DYI37_01815 [Fulvimarina endophytica]|uniref:Curlin n=1 Tax=Fulvimarina endophytica TaxID=2293836 RepID=A0A371XAF6_9HYPH|nr:hypothetical protein [Fulvimarina endophytica]RFC66223.1 hypothetical protein DYI37_01815 [Fulvimarina endophytica]